MKNKKSSIKITFSKYSSVYTSMQNRIKKRMIFTLSKEVEDILRKLSEKTHIKMSGLVEIAIKKLKQEYKKNELL